MILGKCRTVLLAIALFFIASVAIAKPLGADFDPHDICLNKAGMGAEDFLSRRFVVCEGVIRGIYLGVDVPDVLLDAKGNILAYCGGMPGPSGASAVDPRCQAGCAKEDMCQGILIDCQQYQQGTYEWYRCSDVNQNHLNGR